MVGGDWFVGLCICWFGHLGLLLAWMFCCVSLGVVSGRLVAITLID